MTTTERPSFPKRVVITGGMPYGNKDLHFGHVGGLFVHADAFARFMRDRIGKENVLFVSGTDCYGSPIVEHHRQVVEKGEFEGSLEEFVSFNHQRQKEVLDAYGVSLDLYAASALGRSGEVHREMSGAFFKKLFENGHLVQLSSPQFFDPKLNVFLNGRQVTGHCPVPGCPSEKAYADECSLGHPYEPKDLISPKSALSGEKPELREVTNWYIDLETFRKELQQWVGSLETLPSYRPFVASAVREFLEQPALYVKQGQEEDAAKVASELPAHEQVMSKNQSLKLVFKSLRDRDMAQEVLSKNQIRFRSGKTLVPFRLTGNVEWGVPSPELKGEGKHTFWVWPESLWAPLSFTATHLESQGKAKEEWKQWWCSKDAQVFQFIGEDNIYFYGPAEMSLFMGSQGPSPSASPEEGHLQLPQIIANNHILFFDKKASSSGAIKPPMARELLNHYTSDQLRAHFLALGLGLKSVGFKPKPFNPKANEKEADPVMKDANLLSNAFNKAVRTCFYTTHKYLDGKIPVGDVSAAVKEQAEKTILSFERTVARFSFHEAMGILDSYAREINKFWTTNFQGGAQDLPTSQTLQQALIDAFHMVRVATVLFHPIAPTGTEMIREYLGAGEDFWDWNRIFEPISAFLKDPATHQIKVLEARVDFFPKHPSQYQ